MPQRSTGTQQTVKPKLFVPQQAQAQQAAPAAGDSTNPPSALAAPAKSAVSGSTSVARDRPAVSSRLSALKAKLDQDKHRSDEDRLPARLGSHNLSVQKSCTLTVLVTGTLW